MAKKVNDQLVSFIDKAGSYVSDVAKGIPKEEDGTCRKEKYGRDFSCGCKKCTKGVKNNEKRY